MTPDHCSRVISRARILREIERYNASVALPLLLGRSLHDSLLFIKLLIEIRVFFLFYKQYRSFLLKRHKFVCVQSINYMGAIYKNLI